MTPTKFRERLSEKEPEDVETFVEALQYVRDDGRVRRRAGRGR